MKPVLLFLFHTAIFSVLADDIRAIKHKFIQVGDTVLFSCINNRPNDEPAILSWIKEVDANTSLLLSEGSHVYINDSRFGVYYKESERKYTLQISRTTRNDTGIYSCIFGNEPDPIILKGIHLQVNWFDNSTITLNTLEGKNVNLTCFREVVPTPLITWKRSENRFLPNGNISYVGEYLNFSATKNDRGEFFCIANWEDVINITKKIIVNVNFAPYVFVKNTRVKTNLNGTFELECLFDALPVPSVSWYLNGTVIDRNSTQIRIQQYTLESYFTTATLEVPLVRLEHYGRYTCAGKNSLGEAENAIDVEPLK